MEENKEAYESLKDNATSLVQQGGLSEILQDGQQLNQELVNLTSSSQYFDRTDQTETFKQLYISDIENPATDLLSTTELNITIDESLSEKDEIRPDVFYSNIESIYRTIQMFKEIPDNRDKHLPSLDINHLSSLIISLDECKIIFSKVCVEADEYYELSTLKNEQINVLQNKINFYEEEINQLNQLKHEKEIELTKNSDWSDSKLDALENVFNNEREMFKRVSSEKDKHISELKSKIVQLENLGDISKINNESMSSNLQELETRNQTLAQQNKDFAITIANLQSNLLISQSEAKAYDGQLESCKKELIDSNKLLEDQKGLITDLESKVAAKTGGNRFNKSDRSLSSTANKSDEKQVQTMVSVYADLSQQSRSLNAKIKAAESKLSKTNQSYEQLYRQSTNLETKIKELKESNRVANEAIHSLSETKKELTTKKRQLELELANLRSSIAAQQKAISRNLNSSSNHRKHSSISIPGSSRLLSPSRSLSRASHRLRSNLTSPAFSEVRASPPNTPDSFVAASIGSKISIPCLNYLGHSSPLIGRLSNEDSALGEKKLEDARNRIKELEKLIRHMATTLDLLSKDNRYYNTNLSTNTSVSNLALDSQEVEPYIEPVQTFVHNADFTRGMIKIDELCDLLTNHTKEFSQLIEAEKQYFSLQIENENLHSALDETKSNLSKALDDIKIIAKKYQDQSNMVEKLKDGLVQQTVQSDNSSLEELKYKLSGLQLENASLKADLSSERWRLNTGSNRSHHARSNSLTLDTQSQSKIEQRVEKLVYDLGVANTTNHYIKKECADLKEELDHCQNQLNRATKQLRRETELLSTCRKELDLMDERYRSLKSVRSLNPQSTNLLLSTVVPNPNSTRPSRSAHNSSTSHHSRTRSASFAVQSADHPSSLSGEKWDSLQPILRDLQQLHSDLFSLLHRVASYRLEPKATIQIQELHQKLQLKDNTLFQLLGWTNSVPAHSDFSFDPPCSQLSPGPTLRMRFKEPTFPSDSKPLYQLPNTPTLSLIREEEFDSDSKSFTYTKPYKEICYGLRFKLRYLKQRLIREGNFRADLAFQKHYLVSQVNALREIERSTIQLVDQLDSSLNSPTTPTPCQISYPNSRPNPPIRPLQLPLLPTLSPSPYTRFRRCIVVLSALFRAKLLAAQWNHIKVEFTKFSQVYSTSLHYLDYPTDLPKSKENSRPTQFHPTHHRSTTTTY